MKKGLKKLIAMASAISMLGATAGALAACQNGNGGEDGYDIETRARTGWKDEKTYTYNTYTGTSPSNWNLFTSEDENDRQVSSYLGGSFFEFDFKYDADGEIVPGDFVVKYSAATKIEDVTATVDAKWGYTAEQKAAGGYAWKLTLRDDLKWDDGTAIKAGDFVYSFQELLDPDFKNHLASEYYGGNYVFHGAKDYLYQGMTDWYDARTPYTALTDNIGDRLIFNIGNTAESSSYGNTICYMRSAMGFPESYNAKAVAEYMEIDADAAAALQGKTYNQIKADPALSATLEEFFEWWVEEPYEKLDFFVTEYTWGDYDFADVGMYAPSDTELVIVLDTQLGLLEDDGSLSYEAPYYMADLPLVKRDLYESCKKAPQAGSTLWTSTYCSSVETTASWGPYKLTKFQSGVSYTLERNTNCYIYNITENDDKYQTDKIVCRTIPEWQTAWESFQLGGIDGIGIDVSIADDYKTSQRAYFTPDDLTASMHIQSSYDALKARESDGVNRTILAQTDFRKALSLAIDRAAYVQTCTTSSLAGLGVFNFTHYYDVAHGGRYRDTVFAKEALLNTYGGEKTDDGKWKVGSTTYSDIDDAIDALTGYNLTLARELVDKAYDAAKEAGDIKDGDTVKITLGTSEDNTGTRRTYEFIKNAWTDLAKGTKLEGKVEVEFDGTHGKAWASDFRAGQFEVSPASGFSGGAWNPYYFIGSEVDNGQSIRYCPSWDTTKEFLKHTVKDADGVETEYNLSIQDWHDSINGKSAGSYNFKYYPEESKLEILAMLEQAALEKYYSIPVSYAYGASLVSYKCEFVTYEYNVFMAYGGIEYRSYNFDDAEWEAFRAENGILNYKW